jgi:hypothetical protein
VKKLDLKNYYEFPDFGNNNNKIHCLLDDIFSFYKNDGNLIVRFLEKSWDKEIKFQTKLVLEQTKLEKEDFMNYKTDYKEELEDYAPQLELEQKEIKAIAESLKNFKVTDSNNPKPEYE